MALQDIVTKGSTDRSVPIYAFDNTTGLAKTDLVFNSSGMALWYRREGAAKVDVTEATLAALTTAHTDGGFLAVGDGEYRLDLPDAAFATGANYVDYGGTATGFTLVGGRIKLIGVNFEDAVRGGMTALPNAAADAAGGLVISDAGGFDIDNMADRVWDEQVDGTTTARQSVRLANSALGGKASGLGTTTAVYRDLADTKDRISATVDSDGNRTAVTRDVT
ncbi:MAG: hypothetical protein Q8N17_26120 [Burkholderiaceae bacterium]|nr:hypothetical protein [Burkholderiaceae bacterium]